LPYCHHLPGVKLHIVKMKRINILIDGPITTSIITDQLSLLSERTDCGGHSFFLGQVRADSIGDKTVAAIEYSAYETMVSSEADIIIGSITDEFKDVKSVQIIHSTGLVKAGEISLLVLVSAGHRRQAIDACSKTVELIKERLPVWKKEIFEDSSHHWRKNS